VGFGIIGQDSFVGVNEVLAPAYRALFPVMGTFGEDFVQVIVGMLFLALVHWTVCPFLHEKGHWFLLHAVGNTISVLVSLQDVIDIARSPVSSMLTPTRSQWPNSIVLSVHFYHLVGFRKSLRAEDYIHHGIFVGILGTLGVLMKGYWGIIGSWPCFFLSGLPGGITYYMLVCVKQGWMNSLTEKKHTSTINTYIRSPGAIIHMWNLMINYHYGTHHLKNSPYAGFFLIGCCLLYFGNGQYYGAQAVADYASKSALAGKSSKGHYDE